MSEEIKEQENEVTQEVTQEIQEPKQPSPAEQNFKELREKAKRAERERDELKAHLEKLQSPKQPEEEDDFEFKDDDLLEGRQIKKYLKKQKELEKKLASYEKQSSSMSVEMQLRNKYPDFDKVVNDSSVERMKQEYPEMFNTIQSSSDLYSKAATAYKLIKQFGLSDNPTFKKEEEQIQHNLSKPRTAASVGTAIDSPLAGANAFANGFTDELKERMRKANLAAMKKKYS